MPIDDQLSELEVSNTKAQELQLQNQLSNLTLPVNELSQLFKEFELIGKQFPPFTTMNAYTIDILNQLERFKQYHNFYLGVTENLGNLSANLEDWKISFTTLSNYPSSEVTIPPSLYKWIKDKTVETYYNINLFSDNLPDISNPSPHLIDLCLRMDDISKDLMNTQNLVQVVSLGTALSKLISKLKDDFTHITGHKITPSYFVLYLNNLEIFSKDKTDIKLITNHYQDGWFQDQSPKLKKSFFNVFK